MPPPLQTTPRLSPFQLSAASGLSPFALVIVSPLLPELSRMYSAPAGEVQFVISVYLIGLCLAQLVLGALSDRFGRRAILLTSLIVYAAMSVVCALSTSLESLVIARFLQACGAAGSAAVCRASVHDVYKGDAAVHAMSYIASAHSIAHTLAPAVGGYMGDTIGVSGVFYFLAVLGLGMFVLSYRTMPETRHQVAGAGRFSFWHMMANNWQVAKSNVFLCYAGLFGLTGAPFFAFLAVAPGYFAEHFGTTGATFGLYWSAMSVAFFIGTITGARMVKRIGRYVMLRATVALSASVSVLWLVVMQFIDPTPLLLIGPPVFLSGLLGIISGVVLSGAIGAVPQLAGTASGLCGSLGMACSAVLTITTGKIYTGTVTGLIWPMTAAMLMSAGLTAILAVIERPTVETDS